MATRITHYLLLLAGVMFVYAVVYHFGMTTYEGEQSRQFLHSLQVVIETFTTTRYGSDAGWDSPQMLVLVMLMDITGVALIFIALPVLVVPLFEEAIAVSVPTEVETELSDHGAGVVRDLHPSIEIIARVEGIETMAKLYRAGAEYVLSLATVSGRMLASTILETEDAVSLDTQVQVIRTGAPRLAGHTIGDAEVSVRERTVPSSASNEVTT